MREMVKEYYGKTLQTSKDLKTSACCAGESLPSFTKEILKQLDSEILEKFYGCGSPIPFDISGCVVLDLGCGTGRDAYVASKLVGEEGYVIGVDMTDEQLDVARRHLNPQMKRFGFSQPNIEFKKCYIEDLSTIGIEDNSVDVVISNCVINLSADKGSVFKEIFRVLKPGGELYFSDVFSDRRVPVYLQKDPVLVGECLGGVLYIEDFKRMLKSVGCLDYRIDASRKLEITDPAIKKKTGSINFYSMNIRTFKLDTLEDNCEDYEQTAKYLGTIEGSEERFVLDKNHVFNAKEVVKVCGNTAAMLKDTRYRKHFKFTGDRSEHYGLFPCAPGINDMYISDQGSCC